MPVARGPQIDTRSALVVGITGVAVAVLLVVFVLWLAGQGGKVEIRLGDTDFDAGRADRMAARIAEGGPLLFSDVAGGSADIIVAHVGDDPDTGWFAYDARRPDDPRACFFTWVPERQLLVDSCDPDDTVAVDGDDLVHHPVRVDDDGHLRIDVTVDLDPVEAGSLP